MYKHFLKPILFRFNPETAHNLLFSLLAFIRHIPFARPIIRAIYHRDSPTLEREVFGISFAGSFAFPDNGDERSQVDAFFRRLETKTE